MHDLGSPLVRDLDSLPDVSIQIDTRRSLVAILARATGVDNASGTERVDTKLTGRETISRACVVVHDVQTPGA